MRSEAASKAPTARQPLRSSSGSDSESGNDFGMGGCGVSLETTEEEHEIENDLSDF